MLDCEPSDIDMEPSEGESGGVSVPELRETDVHVLEREREAGPGLVNTGAEETREQSITEQY